MAEWMSQSSTPRSGNMESNTTEQRTCHGNQLEDHTESTKILGVSPTSNKLKDQPCSTCRPIALKLKDVCENHDQIPEQGWLVIADVVPLGQQFETIQCKFCQLIQSISRYSNANLDTPCQLIAALVLINSARRYRGQYSLVAHWPSTRHRSCCLALFAFSIQSDPNIDSSLITNKFHCSDFVAVVNPVAHPDKLLPFVPVPAYVDWVRTKGWIDDCCSSHDCQRPIRPRESSPVAFLRVIDCERYPPVVITAPIGCVYIALSYVWGIQRSRENAPHDPSLGLEAHCTPKVVSDAIEVVRSLSYKYLWVDRYCIRQNDEQDKHIQIQNMGSIYEQALFTIVAAAGEDADHGLPGVSGPGRTSVAVGDSMGFRVDTAFPGADKLIEKSKWTTRAWTYQEYVFSARTLVFFEHFLHFECSNSRSTEPLAFSSIISATQKFQSGIKDDPQHIRWAIGAYSKRELTYDSDALNGFLGILKAYSELEPPTYHLWGIPLTPKPSFPNLPKKCQLIESLIWAHDRDDEEICLRRAGFPSWSWTGWKGRQLTLEAGVVSEVDCQNTMIWLEMKDGRLISIDDYNGLAQGFRFYENELVPVLYIEAPTIRIRFLYFNSLTLRTLMMGRNCVGTLPGFYCPWNRDQNIYSYASARFSRYPNTEISEEKTWTEELTLIQLSSDPNDPSDLWILIVDERANQAERIGRITSCKLWERDLLDDTITTQGITPLSDAKWVTRQIRLT